MNMTLIFGIVIGYLLACIDNLRKNVNNAAVKVYKYVVKLVRNKISDYKIKNSDKDRADFDL